MRSSYWDINNPSKSWTAKASDFNDDYTIGGQVGQTNTKGKMQEQRHIIYWDLFLMLDALKAEVK